MSQLLAQVHESGTFDLLQSLNPEALSAALILAIIGTFVTMIIAIVTITGATTNMRVLKLHHSMVKDLLSQGYSVDDIERLTMGGSGLGKQVKKLVRAATDRISKQHSDLTRPVPPIKQKA